jgi:hypothetical protein
MFEREAEVMSVELHRSRDVRDLVPDTVKGLHRMLFFHRRSRWVWLGHALLHFDGVVLR